MKKIILTAVFAFATYSGFAQDEALKKDVLKVIELSGSGGQMAAAKKQLLGMIPKEKQAAFIIEFDALMPKIYDASAKVYMEEFTKEDIKAMLAFYESPVGKKMAEKSEVIATKSQEGMAALQGEIQALMMKYMQ
ncbi:hypothetical protein GCM10011508_10590 [Flavobacterium lutivivi]|nr:hypothetical protein GCM10011508_10590 [Flavobacterium lutivivi]